MPQHFSIPMRLEGKLVYNLHQYVALAKLMEKGYTPLFMPTLVDSLLNSPSDSPLRQFEHLTPSVRATGKTSAGTPVVVYAHIPHYLSDPENIKTEINRGLVKYAARMPQEKFQHLVDLDETKDWAGNRLVWVVDYNPKNALTLEMVSVQQAIEHPETTPFFGAEKRAQDYIDHIVRKDENLKPNPSYLIEMGYSDDLSEQPVGRLLYRSYLGFSGNWHMGRGGSFVGVRQMVPLENRINA